MWPKLDEIDFIGLWDFDLCKYFWSLIFWSNQCISGPGTYVISVWWNLLKYLRRCYIHPVFGSLHAVTSTFDLLTPKSNQHIFEIKYICDKNWVKFPLLVFEIWCSQGFHTHRCTHSRTDIPEYRMPSSPF